MPDDGPGARCWRPGAAPSARAGRARPVPGGRSSPGRRPARPGPAGAVEGQLLVQRGGHRVELLLQGPAAADEHERTPRGAGPGGRRGSRRAAPPSSPATSTPSGGEAQVRRGRRRPRRGRRRQPEAAGRRRGRGRRTAGRRPTGRCGPGPGAASTRPRAAAPPGGGGGRAARRASRTAARGGAGAVGLPGDVHGVPLGPVAAPPRRAGASRGAPRSCMCRPARAAGWRPVTRRHPEGAPARTLGRCRPPQSPPASGPRGAGGPAGEPAVAGPVAPARSARPGACPTAGAPPRRAAGRCGRAAVLLLLGEGAARARRAAHPAGGHPVQPPRPGRVPRRAARPRRRRRRRLRAARGAGGGRGRPGLGDGPRHPAAAVGAAVLAPGRARPRLVARARARSGVVDPLEVASVLRAPVADLVDPANRVGVRYPAGRGSGPGFLVGGLFVWGFTAGLLSWVLDLAGLARPWDSDARRRPRGLPARR